MNIAFRVFTVFVCSLVLAAARRSLPSPGRHLLSVRGGAASSSSDDSDVLAGRSALDKGTAATINGDASNSGSSTDAPAPAATATATATATADAATAANNNAVDAAATPQSDDGELRDATNIVINGKQPVVHEDRPVIIGICGGTGSGKTTLTRAIIDRMGCENVTIISHDSYYKDLSHLSMGERAQVNFDDPQALDSDLLRDHIQAIKNFQAVQVPVYDFTTHSRTADTQKVTPKKIVLIDGILIFAVSGIIDELDLKIYVDTDDDIRLIRRMKRDIEERGRTLQGVIDQYHKTVRPMHRQHVEPSKKWADIIVPSGKGIQEAALDTVVSRLKEIVHVHHLRNKAAAAPEKGIDAGSDADTDANAEAEAEAEAD